MSSARPLSGSDNGRGTGKDQKTIERNEMNEKVWNTAISSGLLKSL